MKEIDSLEPVFRRVVPVEGNWWVRLEGGELGYVLVHAFGSVLDNPDLLTVAVVGDGRPKPGPLEGSWKSISFLNPVHDGAVLPILHLNGAKIAGPTVLGRKPVTEVRALLKGHGYDMLEVTGDDVPGMHHRFAEALATAYSKIVNIQDEARQPVGSNGGRAGPRSSSAPPRGWTGPKEVDGVTVTGTWRSHLMEVLSEHNCHGWLEGYTLTGRHGLFATYEAFAMVSSSQTIQHTKWLEEANHLPWRAKVPSLNILLTSTCWRNDHNGFSHQGPGLIQTVITHRGDVARVYLPPDANTLLTAAAHCFRSKNYVNLIVIDKQPQQQWLTNDEAIEHCVRGAGIWPWAGTDDGSSDPDIVLACAGDVVTMETMAAAQSLRDRLPNLKVRVENVVDLMCLPRPQDHPHGLDNTLFRELFTDHVDVGSLSTASRERSTSWCTAGPTRTGSTSAASSNRAPRRPRSTWSSETRRRAITWSWMRSTTPSAPRPARVS